MSYTIDELTKSTENLKAGFDTVQIVAPKEFEVADIENKIYIRETKRLNEKIYYKVNPNTFNNCQDIHDMKTYEDCMNEITEDMKLETFYKNRYDFKFDFYERGSYDKWRKIHSTLLMLVDQKYNIENRFESYDPITGKHLTCRAQNKRFEIEFYDKHEEEASGNVHARLELRSKSCKESSDEIQEVAYWFNTRFQKAVTKQTFIELQKRLNYHLLELFAKERYQNNCTVSEFLYRYQYMLLTSGQLTEFLKRLKKDSGELMYQDPAQAAKKYISRRNIEVIKFNTLNHYANNILLNKAIEFLES